MLVPASNEAALAGGISYHRGRFRVAGQRNTLRCIGASSGHHLAANLTRGQVRRVDVDVVVAGDRIERFRRSWLYAAADRIVGVERRQTPVNSRKTTGPFSPAGPLWICGGGDVLDVGDQHPIIRVAERRRRSDRRRPKRRAYLAANRRRG